MNRHLKIFLVEADSLVRDAIISHLKAIDPEIEMSGTASCADIPVELSPAAATQPMDGIILASHTVDSDMFDKIGALREGFPRARLIVLVSGLSAEQAAQVIASGAAGILTKSMSGHAIIHAMRLVAVGEIFLPAIFDRAAPRSGREILPPLDMRESLTVRDGQVLTLLCGGLTNRGIAEALSLAEVTVKMQLSRVFKKLHATNRADAVRIALSNRLVSDSEIPQSASIAQPH